MAQPQSPPPPSEADLDRFMQAEVREGRRIRVIPWTRLAVTLLLLAALGWLATDMFDEAVYHFKGGELVVVGDVTAATTEQLEPGQHVQLTGVLGNKAATVQGLRPGSFRRGPIQIRQLLGSQVFVEFDQDELYGRYQPFRRITTKGRLVDFGPGGDLGSVRQYFASHFLMDIPPGARLLIVGEEPGGMNTEMIILLLMLLIAAASVAFSAREFGTKVVD